MGIKCFFFFLSLSVVAQHQTPSDFGFRHYKILFENDTVYILVKSKAGEEHIKKPLLFEVQGSKAIPLIVHDGKNRISSVSLTEGFVENNFHLVLVNKPGIPLIVHQDSIMRPRYQNVNSGKFSDTYSEKNYLDYYVRRNNKVLKYLRKQAWVDTTKIVVLGHSEGSTIATHMADKISGITHLIYSSGLPYFPKILAMMAKERKQEDFVSNPWVEKTFGYWSDIIKKPFQNYEEHGWESNFSTNSFSQSENEILKRLKIPVLVTYGTRDEASPFNDMFRIETIKDRAKHIEFNGYIGLDHYYRNDTKDVLPKVVGHWLQWINKN